MSGAYFHEPTPRPSSWTHHRCLQCGESFAGRGAWKATERFFTHPKHRACVERWYPIVDVPRGPLQAGGGVKK